MTESTDISKIKGDNDLAMAKLDMAQKKAQRAEMCKKPEATVSKTEQKVIKHQEVRKEQMLKNKPVQIQQNQKKREEYKAKEQDRTNGKNVQLDNSKEKKQKGMSM